MDPSGTILVATRDDVVRLDGQDDVFRRARGLDERSPTCLAARPGTKGPAWCGTTDAGVYRSDDEGLNWHPAGLDGAHVTAVTVDPVQDGVVWAGTEPSAVWMGRWEPESGSDAEDPRVQWERREGLLELPSSDDWSFPPRPETHHVRWIVGHPLDTGRLWVAVEAGALITTDDGGASWMDRVEGSPHDTHEVAVHSARPDVLHIAAGDGYFESPDGGRSWRSPMEGLEVGYLRSVALAPDDPTAVLVSAASKARSAYAAFRADGRLYRREGEGAWRRVRHGWPEPPDTVAPLLLSDPVGRRILAADERGVHASSDRGVRWETLAHFGEEPAWLRGLAVL